MKKLILLISCLIPITAFSQIDTLKQIRLNDSLRIARDVEFKSSEESPLKEEDKEEFEKLAYYPIKSEYMIMAYLEKTPNEKPFKMPTSTTRLPEYVQYGILHFVLKGDTLELAVYRNIAHQKHPLYKDYLFLPFTDSTNSFATYGGGRYLDLKMSDSDSLLLDFNQAYNPYCAYNHKYSCPIPPAKNRLKIAIHAGVQNYKDE